MTKENGWSSQSFRPFDWRDRPSDRPSKVDGLARTLRNRLPSGRHSLLHAAGAYQSRRRREARIGRDGALWTFVVDRLAEGLSAQWETDPLGNSNLTNPPRWFLRQGGADANGGGTDGVGCPEEPFGSRRVLPGGCTIRCRGACVRAKRQRCANLRGRQPRRGRTPGMPTSWRRSCAPTRVRARGMPTLPRAQDARDLRLRVRHRRHRKYRSSHRSALSRVLRTSPAQTGVWTMPDD
jgi:hypothetical protein